MESMMEKLCGTRTEENLRTAFAGESQARNKYTYYAKKAEEDGMNQIAEIFRITALNEEQHAKIWFKLLNDGIGSTEENLKNAAEGEHFEWAEMYADFAKTAEEEGFANIARLFSGVAAIEKSHEQRFLTLERSVREGEYSKVGRRPPFGSAATVGILPWVRQHRRFARCAAIHRRTSSAGRKTTDVRRRALRSGQGLPTAKRRGSPEKRRSARLAKWDKGKAAPLQGRLFKLAYCKDQALNMSSRKPAATAEPITPATLGPMACISRKLVGLYLRPST